MTFRIAGVLLVSAMLFAMFSAAPMLLTYTKANTATHIAVAGDPVGGGVPCVVLPFGDPVGGGVPQNQLNGSQAV